MRTTINLLKLKENNSVNNFKQIEQLIKNS